MFLGQNKIKVSYADYGNSVRLQIEDNCPWFNQRDDLIKTIITKYKINGGGVDIAWCNRVQIKELEKEHPDEDLEERFNNLEPVKFKWRKQAQHHNAAKKEKYHYGLIAQNVLAEFPECTFEKPDGYLGIDYMGLTSVLILKVQKQNKLLK